MQALKEKVKICCASESGTAAENDVLRYKVMSMEADLKMQKGQSLQNLKIVDELYMERKELAQQVALLKRELALAHQIMAGEDKQTQTELQETD